MQLVYLWKHALANKLLKNQGRGSIQECKDKGHDPLSMSLGNTSIQDVISFVESLEELDDEDDEDDE